MQYVSGATVPWFGFHRRIYSKSQKTNDTSLRICRPTQIMTIVIHFHQSHYRDFKTYYINYVKQHLYKAFPDLVSYNRFVELMPSILVLLCLLMHFQSKTLTGIYFIDSTTLSVCHPKRSSSNRVFKGLAKK